MNKKKKEHGIEYNGKKKEHKYYDKYRITMDKRESMNIIASIGLQHTFKFYIIIHTIWQHYNVSKLYSWCHRETYHNNMPNVFKKIFYYTNKVAVYWLLHFWSLASDGWTIPYAFLKKCNGGTKLRKNSGTSVVACSLLQRFPYMYDSMWFYVPIQNEEFY